jgi:threonine dehydrogenase-like Zn-dependent dehydrogenase
MEQDRIKVAPVVSSIVSMDELPATFERLLSPGDDVKVLVDPQR